MAHDRLETKMGKNNLAEVPNRTCHLEWDLEWAEKCVQTHNAMLFQAGLRKITLN